MTKSLYASPIWGPKEYITSIEVGSGAAYFASPSYTSCGSESGFTRLDFGATNAREIYAAILAAYSSGKPVKLLTNGCTGPYYIVNAVQY